MDFLNFQTHKVSITLWETVTTKTNRFKQIGMSRNVATHTEDIRLNVLKMSSKMLNMNFKGCF